MGEKALREGVRAKVSSYVRNFINSSSPRAKVSGNYLNSALAKMEAKELGYDEAILLDVHGFVSEGSGENIFYVKNGILYTPHPYSILLGITRDSVIQITPIVEVDGRTVGSGKPGDVTRRLQDVFFRVVRGEEPGYESWLSYVKEV
jgi:branched-chain amino acid aminotransferase